MTTTTRVRRKMSSKRGVRSFARAKKKGLSVFRSIDRSKIEETRRTLLVTFSLFSTETTPGLNFATTGTCPGKIPKSPVSAGTKTMFTSSSAKTASCGKRKLSFTDSGGGPAFFTSSSPLFGRSPAGMYVVGVDGGSIIDGRYLSNNSWNFSTEVCVDSSGALDRVDDEIVRQNGRASPPRRPPPRRPRDDAAVPRIAPASALRNAMLLLVATNKTKERECSSFFLCGRRRREEYSFSYVVWCTVVQERTNKNNNKENDDTPLVNSRFIFSSDFER